MATMVACPEHGHGIALLRSGKAVLSSLLREIALSALDKVERMPTANASEIQK